VRSRARVFTNDGRAVRCSWTVRLLLRYLHEGPLARAFGVLDTGGRTRTGTTRMDSPVLYQLSYPGVVSEVYGAF
jgi:hypothetical protein